MSTPDVALRDSDRYNEEQGRKQAHDEQVEDLADDLLDSVEEVEDLLGDAFSTLLDRALAEVLVELRRAPWASLTPAQKTCLGYLRVLALEEVECRLRDGDVT